MIELLYCNEHDNLVEKDMNDILKKTLRATDKAVHRKKFTVSGHNDKCTGDICGVIRPVRHPGAKLSLMRCINELMGRVYVYLRVQVNMVRTDPSCKW